MEHANSSDAVTFKTATSLGMLHNDCLMDIFQFLKPIDYFHLSKTNGRLRAIADRVGKFEEIEIIKSFSCARKTVSNDQLADIISMVGNRISSLDFSFYLHEAEEICRILEMISQNCKQLKNLAIKIDCNQSFLKSLKTCIATNPGIEHMFLHISMENSDLMLLLPELKSLGIVSRAEEEVNLMHLKNLNRLTRLTIANCPNTIGVLSELAKKGMLEELYIHGPKDEDHEGTFNIIRSFENLQILSVSSRASMGSFHETTILPSKLKYLHLGWFEMSREALLSIIRQLRFLKELVLDECSITNMNIVWSDKDSISNQWHRIAEELRNDLNQRILTIHFWSSEENGKRPWDSVKKYFYESSHLKVLSITYKEYKTYEQTIFELKIPAENKWRIKI